MTAYGLNSISIPNRESLSSSALSPGFPHVRSAQPFMWCGQLGQNVILKWAKLKLIHEVKSEYSIFVCINLRRVFFYALGAVEAY